MARNSEKQYGKLNRLILFKEKQDCEKNNPQRPNLKFLETPEEIQKWIPSIKKDIEFYLMKSQVTCYSDAQIDECKQKVIYLEKEFKAFVRKLKQISPATIDVIPWTNRAYKRKHFEFIQQAPAKKQFIPIETPILSQDVVSKKEINIPITNMTLFDEPLAFCTKEEINSKSLNKSTDENISRVQTDKSKMHQLLCSDYSNSKVNAKAEYLCKLSAHNIERTSSSLVSYTCSSDSDS